MTPIAPHITAFLQQRLPIERGASGHTCDSYAYAFKLLFEFAGKYLKVAPSALKLEQIDAPLVLQFLNHLENGRGNKQTSRNTRLAAVKSFMHFMEYRTPAALDQIRRVIAIPMKKADSRLVRHLTLAELQSILDAPDPTTRDGVRDRAMHLCFAAALRVSELVGVRLGDVTLQPSPSVLIRGKGRRERCLPLWKETVKSLRAWLAVRQLPGQPVLTPELFTNARGAALSRSGFEYILCKHVQSATKVCSSLSQKRVSPHVLRHYVARPTMSAQKANAWCFLGNGAVCGAGLS